MPTDHDPGRAIRELQKYKERLTAALKVSGICVFEVDLKRQLYTFFENAEDIFGVSGESILKDVQAFSRLDPDTYQKKVSEYFSHPADQKVISDAFQSIFKGEATSYQARMKAGNTSYIWCKIDVTPVMENGVPTRMIGVVTNIDDMKTKTVLYEKQLKLDGFTGLYSKRSSFDMMREAIAKESEKKHAMVVFDVDGFKNINDTYGHTAGDAVLQSVSERLKERFHSFGIIGRFGGDEFILLFKDLPPDDGWLPQQLQQLLQNDDNDYRATKSIGVSLYPDDAKDFETLFQMADRAMYYAKQHRSGCVFYQDIKENRL